MKLTDFGDKPDNNFFRNILEWSRKKISFDDNLDCVTITIVPATAEIAAGVMIFTTVAHPLGRVPKGVIPLLQFPGSTCGMEMMAAPTTDKLFIKFGVANKPVGLLIF